MRTRTIVLIVVLAAAAFGSWYLARANSAADERALAPDTGNRGYYLKHARILGTGGDGGLLYEIEAEHAEQQANKVIEFTNVRIRYSPDSDVPWIVNADEASLVDDASPIRLRGHVRIVNHGDEEHNETEIRTQYLELDPAEFIAATDERVQIRIGERSLTATGMLASLHDDRIELKSNVRGKIAP